jgi:hypothetical protein
VPVRRSTVALLFLALLLGTGTVAAQEPTPGIPRPEEVEFAPPPRAPFGAFARSVLIPGWGQAWVGAHTRGGVYFAMEAGSLWMVYRTRRKLAEAEAQEAWLREMGRLREGERSPLVRARRDQREDWTTLAVFILFLSGADAFASAYLADFGERVQVIPEEDGAFRIGTTVPLGRR